MAARRASAAAGDVGVAVIDAGAADADAHYVAEFRRGLSEHGTIEGQNVTVEYHWLEHLIGQNHGFYLRSA